MKLDKQLVTINPSTFINAWFHHNHLISFSIFQVIHSFLQCHYKRAFGLGVLPNLCVCSTKHIFLDIFESHSTIYTFKNYFTIVFSIINFQFSANK